MRVKRKPLWAAIDRNLPLFRVLSHVIVTRRMLTRGGLSGVETGTAYRPRRAPRISNGSLRLPQPSSRWGMLSLSIGTCAFRSWGQLEPTGSFHCPRLGPNQQYSLQSHSGLKRIHHRRHRSGCCCLRRRCLPAPHRTYSSQDWYMIGIRMASACIGLFTTRIQWLFWRPFSMWRGAR